MVGDPSDKESARRQQTLDDALGKAKSYAEQAFRVLDRDKTRIRYNHEWLSELSFGDVVGLASNFTVQQFLARENFAKRFAKGDAIWLHEFFYALMQGYDAVAQETDVQIGGTDQLFNLMAGRKLMEAYGLKPQVVLTFPILEGTDGVLRMSKSLGNSIGIDEPPGVIFTKVLNLPDNVMRNYAELVTRWEQADIDGLFAEVESGQMAMRDFKHKLAWEIVSIFQGDAAADQAAEDARRMFEGQAPSDAPIFTLATPMNILDVLLEGGVVKSKGEARRLVEQSGVRLDGAVIDSKEAMLEPHAGEQVIQAGKRKFLRVRSAI
jgi:tyrosyl-tRNA synthetase